MKFSSILTVGIRAGLLLAPVVLVVEAGFILLTGGPFLYRALDLPVALARYCGYGAILGFIVAFFLGPFVRLLSPTSTPAILLAAVATALVGVELGLYAFDIVAPWGSLQQNERLKWFGIVAGICLVLFLVLTAWARGMAKRVDGALHQASGFGFSVRFLLHVALALGLLMGLPRLWARHGNLGEVQPRPNILVVVLDTVRADALSAWGQSVASTPYLDRFAEEGIRFSRATSASTWTPPGHASLFTGLFPMSHGTRGLQTVLAGDVDVLPDILASAGYSTLSLYNNPLAGRLNAMDRGFGRAIGVETDQRVSLMDERLYAKFVQGDTGAARSCRLLKAWIADRAETKRPWMAFVNLNDAHMPYQPRDPWMESLADTLRVDLETIDVAKLDHAMTDQGLAQLRRGEIQLDETERAWMKAAYYSEVSAMDQILGRALEDLRNDGLLENTILVVTSDHGEALGEDDEFGHADGLHPAVVRIPLILWAPDRLQPAVDDRWASLVDVVPTLLELVELDHQPEGYAFQGRSLVAPRGTDADATLLEHTTLDTEACDAFAVLQEDRGLQRDCEGWLRVLDVAADSLTHWAWGDTLGMSGLQSQLEGWIQTNLNDRTPSEGILPEDVEALQEKLRAMGYVQ